MFVEYFTERVVDRLKYLSVSSNSRFQNLAQICLQAYSSRCPHQPSSMCNIYIFVSALMCQRIVLNFNILCIFI